MPEFWEVTHTRAQQTNAVWNTFNPAFTVGALTLTAHQTNADLLFTQAGDVITQQDVLDGAISGRDQNLDVIHRLNTRVPQLIRSNLEDDDPLQKEVLDVLAVDLGSFAKELKRARRLISLWTRVNAARAALPTPLPEIDRSGTTVADLQTAVDDHPGLLQTIEDERANLSQVKSALEATEKLVDDGNKDWYEAWKNYYEEGTPEYDALSQIETEGGATVPTALEIESLVQNGLSVEVSYVAGGGQHATTLTLLWQVEGVDPGFDNSTMVILAGQTIGPFEMDQTINVKTRAANSAGSTDSAVQSTALP